MEAVRIIHYHVMNATCFLKEDDGTCSYIANHVLPPRTKNTIAKDVTNLCGCKLGAHFSTLCDILISEYHLLEKHSF